MIQNQYYTLHIPRIVTVLRSGHLVKAISEGSFHPDLQHGTSAWLIPNPFSGKVTYGNNVVLEPKSAQCDHRSKLSVLTGIVKQMNDICTTYNITKGTIKAGCDGEAAYLAATRAHFVPTTQI